jgi:hypothetical protein
MKKNLIPTGDLMIQFTEDELRQLNIAPDDKFDFKLQTDGSVKLEKYVKLEIDMDDWPIELLHMLIKESCERDVSVNEVIVELVKNGIDKLD